MQDKHTEHNDQLDKYYKENLEHASVNPPADMWNRIATAMDEQQKPKGFWSNKKWMSPMIILFIVGSLSIYYITSSSKKTSSSKNIEKEVTIPTLKEIEKNEVKKVTNGALKPTSSDNNTSTSSIKKESNSTVPPAVEENNNKIGAEQKSIVPETKPTEEILTTPEPIVEKVTPKKKLGFREKHTEALKDSVRPLFVPTK